MSYLCAHCDEPVGRESTRGPYTTCYCGKPAHTACQDKCPQKPRDESKLRSAGRRPVFLPRVIYT